MDWSSCLARWRSVQLERRTAWALRAQRAIAEFGVRALTTRDVDAPVRDALEHVRGLLDADIAALLEVGVDGRLYIAAQSGNPTLTEGDVFPRHATELALAKTWAREHAEYDDASVEDAPPEASASGVQAWTLAVLPAAEPMGVLAAAWCRPHTADDAETEVLQGVANVLAGARNRQRYEQEAVTRALHDTLTGLPTRPLLLDRLDQALARQERDGGGLAVLLLDLDGFKAVNDRFGHAAGDAVLASLGPRLTACLRPSDTAGRLGGDEFLILCENVPDSSVVAELVERVHDACTEPFRLDDGTVVQLSGSIGAAFAETAGQDADSLLRGADAAMYRNKHV